MTESKRLERMMITVMMLMVMVVQLIVMVVEPVVVVTVMMMQLCSELMQVTGARFNSYLEFSKHLFTDFICPPKEHHPLPPTPPPPTPSHIPSP